MKPRIIGIQNEDAFILVDRLINFPGYGWYVITLIVLAAAFIFSQTVWNKWYNAWTDSSSKHQPRFSLPPWHKLTGRNEKLKNWQNSGGNFLNIVEFWLHLKNLNESMWKKKEYCYIYLLEVTGRTKSQWELWNNLGPNIEIT